MKSPQLSPPLVWQGRFPQNEIISLLDLQRPFNLAESTSQDLTVGAVMDLIGEVGLREIRLGYGASAGLEALRHAVGLAHGVSSSQVVTTTGVALGLFLLAFELCRPEDEVVLVTPCFPPARDTFLACGLTPREVALRFEDGYQLDLPRLAAALSPRTRLVSLASPQNPSGVAVTPTQLASLLNLMAELAPQARLFIDETYRQATYGDAPIAASAAGSDPRVIVGASISKAYGAPGLRIGWLIVPDATLREQLVVAKMNLVISGSPLDEALAAGLLTHQDAVLAPRRQALANALEVLTNWQRAQSARLEWVRPDAGALCCLRLSTSAFDAAAVARFWRSLPALNLQLAPGAWFGESDRVFRLGFGYLPYEQLLQALGALAQALDEAS